MMRYEKATDGIRVVVRPQFSLADSEPSEGTFVFSYDVRMANEGDAPAQLLFRHWHIHDAGVGDTEVDGEGVVGVQPVLGPGEAHEYRSYCVLHSPIGYMEGYYTFIRPDGDRFRVEIPRFQLNGPLVLPSSASESAEQDEQSGLIH